jgi:hypothetical protein
MKMKLMLVVLAVALLAVPASAGIIYSEAFDGAGVALHGTTTTTGGGTWNANLIANDNGTLLIGTANGSALLPVSLEGSKTYTLSVDATLSSGYYLFLGFCQNNIVSPGANNAVDRFNNAARGTFPTMAALYQNGATLVQGADYYSELLGSTSEYSTAQLHTYKMVLTTASDLSSGTVSYYVDNVAFVTNGVVDYAALSTINYVGFSTRATGGTIDNFELSVVPEPATISILALGGLVSLMHRRR